MKILFVNEKCGYFGGVEQNIAVTAAGLINRGHSCYLAYWTETDRDSSEYKKLFSKVFQLTGPNPGNKLESLADKIINTIFEEIYPDAIYLHKIHSITPFLQFLGRVRIIRMIHDHDLCCPRRHKYYFHNERVCTSRAGIRCYLDLAFIEKDSGTGKISIGGIGSKLREMKSNQFLDCLLVGSSFMKNELLQNGFSPSSIHILPPLVPFSPRFDSPVPDDPVILCVAQLIKGKGVDLLLKALSSLTCEFRTIIVGAGNSEHDLKRLSRELGLEEKVQFTGWVPNKVIGEFYSKAKVVAVPCRWPEPFGMIGLEAMNFARPVVAFNVGGISDWLDHGVTGVLVPEQDVAAFSKSLQSILTNTDTARKMGTAAVHQASQKYSFDDYISRTIEILRD